MASSSLRLSPPASCYVWRRNVLAASSRRTVLSSIRLQSTDVSQGAKNTLPWSEYLAIRRGKRKWEMVSLIIWSHARDDVIRILFLLQALTIPCVLAGLAGGAAYFGSMELDASKPIMVREFLFI
jgi:import inner membrane translocase subunit TIM23